MGLRLMLQNETMVMYLPLTSQVMMDWQSHPTL
jgi:hypothetical protein